MHGSTACAISRMESQLSVPRDVRRSPSEHWQLPVRSKRRYARFGSESMMLPTSLTRTGTIRFKTAVDQLTAEGWVRFIESTPDLWPSRSRVYIDRGNRKPR